jgi:RNA polymerase sigma-70 factor, ECF subfamily
VSNEDELIQRAQTGDREAFGVLLRAYQRRIYSLALHYTRNPMDAEDLSQEVWMKAYRSLPGFRGESGFYTWLRQITIRTLLNQQRTSFWLFGRKPSTRVSLDDVEVPQYIEANLHDRLLIEQVRQVLDTLTPRERLIFLLKHQEGMTYEEIAESCGVSVGTIKKALFRTVTKLREQLGVQIRSSVTELPRPLTEFPESDGAKC